MKLNLIHLLKIIFLSLPFLFIGLYSFSYKESRAVQQLLIPFESESFEVISEGTVVKAHKFYPNISSIIKERDIDSKNSLGVKISWDNKTRSKYFDIVPQEEYSLKKVVTSFNILVWSGNYKGSTLCFLLESDKGDEYLVEIGDLGFYGWKELTTDISEIITRGDGRYSPAAVIKRAKLKAFRIYVNPAEKKEVVHVFLDNLNYFYKPLRRVAYDGVDIEDVFLRENQEEYQQDEVGTLNRDFESDDDDDLLDDE